MAGCYAGETGPVVLMDMKDHGFTMLLPPGWQQGWYSTAEGYYYSLNPTGHCFFKSDKRLYPSGEVLVMGWFPGDKLAVNLEKKPPFSKGRIISQREFEVYGQQAFEFQGQTPGKNEKTIDVIHVYFLWKGFEFLVSFRAPKGHLRRYEPYWHACIDSIELCEPTGPYRAPK